MICDIKELCLSKFIGEGRALCVDYGDKRIGLAVSDIQWRISSPLVVLESHGVFPKIKKIITEYVVLLIVVGCPKSLSGGFGGMQNEKVKKFTEKLAEIYQNISIIYWDERMSTVAAERFLLEADVSRSKKKNTIDKVAASFILCGFLNYCDTIANKEQVQNIL